MKSCLVFGKIKMYEPIIKCLICQKCYFFPFYVLKMRGRLTFSVVLQLSKYGMSASPHGVTTQKTDIDIFTALKTSNFL
jgi:hypothetical protein